MGDVGDRDESRSRRFRRYRPVAVLLGLAAWFWVDVRLRAEVSTTQPDLHKTDFTVFTAAGAAFFDGRDPYAVTNPRGWYYLYPPIFALMVAPLARLDTYGQVGAWYAISVALTFGCIVEARRLWRRIAAGVDRGERRWIAWCAALAVVLPTLECLQRGQVGIALLYGLLLGHRLVLEGRGPGRAALGGVVLAWTVAVKLIPALPVAVLAWHRLGRAFRPESEPGARPVATALMAGIVLGGGLFLVAIPGGVLGWQANVRHLETWAQRVAMNDDPGQTSRFDVESPTNQSFTRAAFVVSARLQPARLAEALRGELIGARTEFERRWGEARAFAALRRSGRRTARVIAAIQGLMLALLLALGWASRREGPAGQAAVFGLACVGMLLLSPVAWTHYYMMPLPALLAVPLWLAARGRHASARLMAAVPPLLSWAHGFAKGWVGPIGLLALGTAAWFLAACVMMLVLPRLDARPSSRAIGRPRPRAAGRRDRAPVAG
jgi:hypothetical protein